MAQTQKSKHSDTQYPQKEKRKKKQSLFYDRIHSESPTENLSYFDTKKIQDVEGTDPKGRRRLLWIAWCRKKESIQPFPSEIYYLN